MKIDLEGLQIDLLVQQAFTNTLRETLAKQLPAVVTKLLAVRDGYGTNAGNLVGRVFAQAVAVEVDKNIAEFLADRQDEIRTLVRQAMEQQLSPAAISERVVKSLSSVRVEMYPMGVKKAKVSVEDLEEED